MAIAVLGACLPVARGGPPARDKTDGRDAARGESTRPNPEAAARPAAYSVATNKTESDDRRQAAVMALTKTGSPAHWR